MIKICFHPEADAELIIAARYYEMQQRYLGKRFLSSIEDSLSRIKINPDHFPMVQTDVRRCLIKIFPYCILFRIRESELEIVAVMHMKRDPEYWQERV